MSETKWKFAQPTVMEDAGNLTWARTSWTFGQPGMMIDATIGGVVDVYSGRGIGRGILRGVMR